MARRIRLRRGKGGPRFAKTFGRIALGLGILVVVTPVIGLISAVLNAVNLTVSIPFGQSTYDIPVSVILKVMVAGAAVGFTAYALHKIGIRNV